ncbi:hypothetical protein D3C73_20110 [compost metagenome]
MLLVWIAVGILALFGFVVLRGAPYVPTKKRDLEQAFDELYPLNKTDVLVDIGSGDGVVLRQAAKRGAKAVGYELNPLLVLISKLLARRYGSLITIRLVDFWLTRLPDDVTIVYTFGESRDIRKMYNKVVQEATRLHKPIYFMSYGFAVPAVAPVAKNRVAYLYKASPLQPR